MFSHNGLISEKQMRCMLVLYVFMGAIFVLPHLLAVMFGKDIIAGTIVFYVACAVYVGIIMFILSDMEWLTKIYSFKIYTFPLSVQITRYILRLVFYILLSVSVLSEGQVPFMDDTGGNSFINLIILLPLLLVALYGAGKDIEKQGRLSEMLMPAAILPYVVMILFGIKECSFKGAFNILPAGVSIGKMMLACYALLSFIVPVEIYPWLKSKVSNNKGSGFKSYISVMGIILLACMISVLMAGIYGINGMADDVMASISIMRYIELPLGVLRRFDVLMVWFFMTGCFVLICNTLFYLKQLLSYVIPTDRLNITIVFLLAAACVLAYICPGYEDAVKVFVVYGALIDLPLSIIILIAGKYGYRAKKIMMALLMLFVISITGCSSDIENIEQRDYATVLMIAPSIKGEAQYTVGIAKERRRGEENESEDVFSTYAKDIDDLSKTYGDRKGKDLSLSHLKVILIAPYYKQRLLSGYTSICNVLDDLNDNDEVAKTCPLIIVADKDRTMEYIKCAQNPIGTYIGDLIDVRKRDNKKVTKLMDYLKALRDGTKVDMLILETEGDDLTIKQINE